MRWLEIRPLGAQLLKRELSGSAKLSPITCWGPSRAEEGTDVSLSGFGAGINTPRCCSSFPHLLKLCPPWLTLFPPQCLVPRMSGDAALSSPDILPHPRAKQRGDFSRDEQLLCCPSLDSHFSLSWVLWEAVDSEKKKKCSCGIWGCCRCPGLALAMWRGLVTPPGPLPRALLPQGHTGSSWPCAATRSCSPRSFPRNGWIYF